MSMQHTSHHRAPAHMQHRAEMCLNRKPTTAANASRARQTPSVYIIWRLDLEPSCRTGATTRCQQRKRARCHPTTVIPFGHKLEPTSFGRSPSVRRTRRPTAPDHAPYILEKVLTSPPDTPAHSTHFQNERSLSHAVLSGPTAHDYPPRSPCARLGAVVTCQRANSFVRAHKAHAETPVHSRCHLSPDEQRSRMPERSPTQVRIS